MSFKALASGVASDRQQKIALDWIIQEACGTYDVTYFSDNERNTTFAEGKRHVGLQVVKLVNLPPAAFEKKSPKPKPGKIDG